MGTYIWKERNRCQLDWGDINVKEYLNHENQTVNSSIRVLKNAKIKTVWLNILKVWSKDQCANKAEFTAGKYLLIVANFTKVNSF